MRAAQSEPRPVAQQAGPAAAPRLKLASSDGRVPVSGVVVTHNEAGRIARCLASLWFCDELLVVDSHSTDGTREVAAAAGARVIERDWPGYRSQKQFAVEAARHDWVFVLDADEVASPALAAEVQALQRAGFGGAAAFSMPRCTEYFGRMIRHGGWYPDRVKRLFDRRRARFGGREVHEKLLADGPVQALHGEVEHYAYRHLHDQLRRLSRYAELMGRTMHAEGRRARWWHLVLSPAWRAFRDLVLKGGWRAGWRGVAIAGIEAGYVRQKFLTLWLLQHGLPVGDEDTR